MTFGYFRMLVGAGLPSRSKSFDKTKASGTFEAPPQAPFAGDYAEVLRSIQALEAKIVTPGFEEKKSILVGLGGSRVKAGHKLFEPREPSEEEEEPESSDLEQDAIDQKKGNKPFALTLSNWPVHNDAARDALDEMKGKHYVVPIPAYDMRGDLIHPGYYRCRLEGALVVLRFNLTHWAIKRAGGGTDVYVADIVSIRVLAPPAPNPVTPRKRGRVPAFDPMSPKPTNKTRRLFE
ncbi:hypothetical protein EW026_g1589 [Hermanssonia centrifuga]|uniref:Uncharacterized protein n=1 Tax=Hermanssonia centrifuga TaxID=98765 RepID=A0A4S4KVG3_9APHY|nr:hypothetical protein EW026_g1589 [Hermanssonia centrifuga]